MVRQWRSTVHPMGTRSGFLIFSDSPRTLRWSPSREGFEPRVSCPDLPPSPVQATGLEFGDGSIRVAETHTLHYAVRLTEPGRIRLFLKLKAGNLLAALPSKHTEEVLRRVVDVYPGMEPAKNVMQTSLQNANPIIHQAVTVANAARIEGAGGDFLFYEEGVSDATGRLIESLDQERIAIGAAHAEFLGDWGPVRRGALQSVMRRPKGSSRVASRSF